jgi:hypothetical protein
MKLKKLDPNSPEVIDAVVEMIRKMTPEEALAFLTYRTPGVKETDMTGMLGNGRSPKRTGRRKRHAAAA